MPIMDPCGYTHVHIFRTGTVGSVEPRPLTLGQGARWARKQEIVRGKPRKGGVKFTSRERRIVN
jgi:hypothetical protein